jgi:hypothetical protein
MTIVREGKIKVAYQKKCGCTAHLNLYFDGPPENFTICCLVHRDQPWPYRQNLIDDARRRLVKLTNGYSPQR